MVRLSEAASILATFPALQQQVVLKASAFPSFLRTAARFGAVLAGNANQHNTHRTVCNMFANSFSFFPSLIVR